MFEKQVFNAGLLKEKLRTDIYAGVRQSAGTPAVLSAEILDEPEFAGITLLFAYVPLHSEVDVRPVVEKAYDRGCTVAYPSASFSCFVKALPGVRFERLSNGTYCPSGDILKPEEVSEKALMLVPGVAFSPSGDRLGRGKGFYDRVLAVLPSCVYTAGVCRKTCIVADIPVEEHDRKVRRVVSV